MLTSKFANAFYRPLMKCHDEFERHYPAKGESWREMHYTQLWKLCKIAWQDLRKKMNTENWVSVDDQAADMVNLLLMMMDVFRKERLIPVEEKK